MSISRNIFHSFWTQILSTFIGLVASVLLTRLLGAEGKGELVIFQASVGLFSLLFGFGLSSSITFYTANGKLPANQLLTTALLQSLLAAGVFLFIVWVSVQKGVGGFFLPADLDSLFYMAVLSACLLNQLCIGMVTAVLSGMRKFAARNFAVLINSILMFVLYGILYLAWFDPNQFLPSGIAFQLVTGIAFLSFLVFVIILKRSTDFHPTWRLLTWGQYWAVCKWGMLVYSGGILQFLNYRLDLWIIDFFLSKEDVGTYGLAVSIGQMFWMLPATISPILLAHVAAKDVAEPLKKVIIICRLILVTGAVGALLIFPFSTFLITVVYGESFQPSGILLNTLMLGIIPFATTKVVAGFLQAHGLQKWNNVGAAIGLVSTLVLDLLLIPVWGAFGAAVASSISYLSSTIFTFFILSRWFHTSWKELLYPRVSDFVFVKNLIRGKLKRAPAPPQ